MLGSVGTPASLDEAAGSGEGDDDDADDDDDASTDPDAGAELSLSLDLVDGNGNAPRGSNSPRGTADEIGSGVIGLATTASDGDADGETRTAYSSEELFLNRGLDSARSQRDDEHDAHDVVDTETRPLAHPCMHAEE